MCPKTCPAYAGPTLVSSQSKPAYVGQALHTCMLYCSVQGMHAYELATQSAYEFATSKQPA
jgi:hypothetical protein